MKYLVPPIVIPVLLVIAIIAYGMLRPPLVAAHPAASAMNSQAGRATPSALVVHARQL